MEFSRQEYWHGLPFPSPGDLPVARIEPGLLNCRQILYYLSTREARILEWVAISSSRDGAEWRLNVWVMLLSNVVGSLWVRKRQRAASAWDVRGPRAYLIYGEHMQGNLSWGMQNRQAILKNMLIWVMFKTEWVKIWVQCQLDFEQLTMKKQIT